MKKQIKKGILIKGIIKTHDERNKYSLIIKILDGTLLIVASTHLKQHNLHVHINIIDDNKI